MQFLSIAEIIDMAIMIAFVGFIFKDFFPHKAKAEEDPIAYYTSPKKSDFWFAVMVTAPAIILHEFGHKIVAILFGFSAVFNAAYGWLILGTILKLMNFGFIFFVPAYVSFGCNVPGCVILPGQLSFISFAGPFVNLVLWIGAEFLLTNKEIDRKYYNLIYLTKQVNMFLFIFNMIPIPGFDGQKVFVGLFEVLF